MGAPSVKLNSGASMPSLALGTWQATERKPGEVEDAVKFAIENGYRHIDCAPLYANEADVGKGIKAALTAGTVKRQELFVTTKLLNVCHEAKEVRPALIASLKDLQLDYLDLYLIHWPFAFKAGKDRFPRDENGVIQHIDVPFMETWEALEKCVDEGLVKSIGLSNFTRKQTQHVFDNSRIKPAAIQLEVHPYFSNEKLVKFCQGLGIVVVAYSPLGSSARPWANLSTEANPPPLFQNKDLIAIGKKHGKTAAQVAIRFLIQRGLSVVPKSATPSRIKENLDVFNFILSPEEVNTVSAINRNTRLITYTAFMLGAGPGITDPGCSAEFFPFSDD